MSEKRFQDELSKIPYSVCVVTVGLGGLENGLTVSWLTQVSFDPPMLAFSIDKKHYSAELIEDVPSFVVNLLREDQLEIAGHFAKRSMTGDAKIDGVDYRATETGLAILTDALAYYECDVVAQHEAGDHWVVIGEVTDAGVLNDGAPLTSAKGLRYKR
ncbi:MAG: flavin reductase [Deltaproteobacteria bacterium]|jgi:flavin reductase (DIM6/NTAB) family NADH-FMN oxidoreductase RutF|nr:flavin reductase [Deltaproteobacteria bacterium]MBW2531511.1 flavin reductase [Deltaproteobacteria bacterium]